MNDKGNEKNKRSEEREREGERNVSRRKMKGTQKRQMNIKQHSRG